MASKVVWHLLRSNSPRPPGCSRIQPRSDFFPHVEGRIDLDLDSLRPGLVVADVIPNPPRTQLIRDAEVRGCVVLDGLGMLVSQGAIGLSVDTYMIACREGPCS